MRYVAPTSGTDRIDVREDADGEPHWELEELGATGDTQGWTWSNRWLGVVIAVSVAVVGFGFAGRLTTVEPSRATEVPAPADVISRTAEPRLDAAVEAAPFVVSSPAEADTIRTGQLEIRGTAARGLGTVKLAIRLGDAILGWTVIDIPTPGPIATSMRVFAPPFGVDVVLRIDSAATPSGAGLAIARPLHLDGPAGVSIWRATASGPGEPPSVLVEGYGPQGVGPVRVEVRDRHGTIRGSGLTNLTYEVGRPGSAGGRMVGLGSFTSRLSLDGGHPSGPMTVQATWTDADDLIHESRLVIGRSTKPGASRTRSQAPR